MANILILYSTVDGHTLKICQAMQRVLEQQRHQVTLLPLDSLDPAELGQYDKIVLGASIRYGKHRPLVYEFIRQNQAVLDSKPSAFFTVNVVARKPDKNSPDTNPYMQKFLEQVSWRPAALGVFAGKIDYRLYSFWDRNIIRFIMWLTKGPTRPDSVVEFTDWSRVEAFAQQLAEL